MNERLKELIEKTVKTTLLEHSTQFVAVGVESESLGKQTIHRIPIDFCEKFAHLIVKDCMLIFMQSEDANDAIGKIKEHFEMDEPKHWVEAIAERHPEIFDKMLADIFGHGDKK